VGGDGTSSSIGSLSLGAGETRSGFDFGFRVPVVESAEIVGLVWDDVNANGVQDAGEAGIPGVRLTARDGLGQVVATRATGGAGTYQFPELDPGFYSVTVLEVDLPAEMVPTVNPEGNASNVASVVLEAGETRSGFDFGFRVPVEPASAGGRVWNDLNGDGVQDANEPGLEGVRVVQNAGTAGAQTELTAADGSYSFDVIPDVAHQFSIDEQSIPVGFVATFERDALDNQVEVSLLPGATDDSIDWGLQPPAPVGSLGDQVWLDQDGDGIKDVDEPGIADVSVVLNAGQASEAVVMTDAAGVYQFEGLAAGDYTLTVDPLTLADDSVQTADPDGVLDNTTSITLTTDEMNTDQDFGYRVVPPLVFVGDDPITCGGQFFGTVSGGIPPYTVTHMLTSGGVSTVLPSTAVAAAGPWTASNVDYTTHVNGSYQVDVLASDSAGTTANKTFAAEITDDCAEPTAVPEPTVTATATPTPEPTVVSPPTIDVTVVPSRDRIPITGAMTTFTVTVTNTSDDAVTVTALVDDVHGDLNGRGDCKLPQVLAVDGSYNCAHRAMLTVNEARTFRSTTTALAVDAQEASATANAALALPFFTLAPSRLAAPEPEPEPEPVAPAEPGTGADSVAVAVAPPAPPLALTEPTTLAYTGGNSGLIALLGLLSLATGLLAMQAQTQRLQRLARRRFVAALRPLQK